MSLKGSIFTVTNEQNYTLLQVGHLKPQPRVVPGSNSFLCWGDKQDRPWSSINIECSTQIEETYTRIKAKGIRSNILGKINYKPKVRHRQSTINTEIRYSIVATPKNNCANHSVLVCSAAVLLKCTRSSLALDYILQIVANTYGIICFLSTKPIVFPWVLPLRCNQYIS